MVRLSQDPDVLAADAEARLLGVQLIERVRTTTGGGVMMSMARQKRHLFLRPGSWTGERTGRHGNSLCQYSGWCHTREISPEGTIPHLPDQNIQHCKLCRRGLHKSIQRYAELMQVWGELG